MKNFSLSLIFIFQFILGFTQQLQDHYAFYEGSGNFYHMTGGNYLFGNSDLDDGTAQVNIGFDFHYDSDVYNTCYISTNGAISFTESNISYNNLLNPPTTNNTGKKNIIAPLWDDMIQRSADNGAVIYKTEGTAPNRRFYVEWKNISWQYTGSTVSFMLVLYETTNNIEFRYGTNNSTETTTASIGISRMINSGSNTFMSVTPGNPATMSYQLDNNAISTSNYPGNNTFYYFKHLTYIPDANFETYLETHDGTGGTAGFNIGNGTDGDHYVFSVRAQYATDISAAFKSISSLSGIQDFTHLEILNVYWNNLSYLNVDKNVNLTGLYCGHNNLSSLDVSNNPLITILKIGENNLTSIDLSNLTALDEFVANDNQFASIDLSNNTALTWLDLSNNQLTGINLSNNTNLYILELNNNQIGGSFNTSIFPNLSTFECANNQITSLNLDSNPNLTVMRANDNHLSSLSIQNGHNGQLAGQQNIPNVGWVSRFKADNNPYLFCIYVDDQAAANAGTGDYQDWESGPVSHYVETNAQCEDYVTYINDSVFENYLETHDANGNTVSIGASNSMGNGIDGDNLVYTARIENVTSLNISNLSQDIHQMGGIEGFAALQYLSCNGNLIVNLDLSNNTNLTELHCAYNMITSLTLPSGIQKVYAAHNRLSSYDLSPFTALTYLDFGFNNLTSITANNIANLITLNLNDNQLTGLDISGDTALTYFNCNNNALTNLNLGTIAAIHSFSCSNNNLTGILDLIHLSGIESAYCTNNQLSGIVFYEYYGQNDLMYLDCSNNQMVELDLSTCTTLEEIDCSNNQLTVLNMASGNNTNLGVFDATNNPDLTCVQVDDESYMNTNWANAIDATASYSNNCHYGETYVPDDNFEHYLETHDANGNTVNVGAANSMGNGTDGDDYVLTSRIENVTSLDVHLQSISDLTGIEYFAMLTSLNCNTNNLTQLDVTNNTNLYSLYCYNNQLTDLNVSGLTSLSQLFASGNQLTNLNVNGLTSLVNLSVHNNQLTTLDLSGLNNLVNLYVNNNNLSSLNVTGNPALQKLYCYFNSLTQLDVSSNPLKTLWCYSNQLTSLDLDNNTQIETLWCNNNQLTELRLNNGANGLLSGTFQSGTNTYPRMQATGNPNLSCIYVDNATDATAGTGDYQDWQVDATAHFVENLQQCQEYTATTYVPDDNFEHYLETHDASGNAVSVGDSNSMGNGIDGDNYVLTYRIKNVMSLTIVGRNISDLTGIEDFEYLNDIDCYNNHLTSLDFSTNTQLHILNCYDNQLTSLILPTTNNLTDLSAGNNQLSSLDVSGCIGLQNLWMYDNQLTALNITSNVNLVYLSLSNNQISNLDVSNNTNLVSLYIDDNQINTLNLNNNSQLERFWCANNQLMELYIQNGANNLLSGTFQFNGSTYYKMKATGNPNLTCIYVDNATDATAGTGDYQDWQVDATAHFVETQAECDALSQHTLTVNTQGQGSVALNPAGGTYQDGTQVTLTATPAQGWQFDHWSGDLSGSTNPATITMDADKTVTAVFTQLALTYVPDDNFEHYLETHDVSGNTVNVGDSNSLGNGTDGDDYVLTYRIENVTSLDVSNQNISDLTGIEDFAALTNLICHSNNLTSLDLSQNTNLTDLSSANNNIGAITLPASIQTLNLNINNFSNISLSGLTNIHSLELQQNNLSNLDISDQINLTYIDISHNNLQFIDLSNNTAIVSLYCNNNQLTPLDVSSLGAMQVLDCSSNQLTDLNVINGNNSNMIVFNATNNPQLTCIYVDDAAWSNSNWSNGKDATAHFVENLQQCQEYTATTYVPDDNFEHYLETHDVSGNTVSVGDSNSLGNGTDGDDYVLTYRIENVTSLDVSNQNISDLTGIEDFINLMHFNCRNNQITGVDLSFNQYLSDLDCRYNQLTSLDLSNKIYVTDLLAEGNSLTSIDITNCTQLVTLNIKHNSVSAIDVASNNHLANFFVDFNNILNLDVSTNTELTYLSCSNNQMTELDVRNGNNSNFTYFDTTNNPDLHCIFVDDAAWSDANWTNIDASSHFVETQAECDVILDVADTNLIDFAIYPNPVSNQFTIEAGENEIQQVKIFDLFGKLIKVYSPQNQYSTQGISSGVYSIKIITNKGYGTEKLIKR